MAPKPNPRTDIAYVEASNERRMCAADCGIAITSRTGWVEDAIGRRYHHGCSGLGLCQKCRARTVLAGHSLCRDCLDSQTTVTL